MNSHIEIATTFRMMMILMSLITLCSLNMTSISCDKLYFSVIENKRLQKWQMTKIKSDPPKAFLR